MGRIGRNEPCPCKSGRKYKKCCLLTGAGTVYTAADRQGALQRLLRWIDPEDMAAARERWWGEHLARMEAWNNPSLLDMAENVLQFSLFFDEQDAGETLAEVVLATERDLGAGERRYLEMGRASAMRLYEVIAVVPGASLTLRDLLGGGEVLVRERAGSRSIHTWDVLAARVMAKGASGQPEIDGGCFPIQSRLKDALVTHLETLRAELDGAELKEAQARALFGAWVDPGMPQLVNYDGDPLLLTRVHFDVIDESKLVAALDAAADFTRAEDGAVWTWVGQGTQRAEPVVFAFIRLGKGRLTIEANSRERGERSRARVEKVAGDTVKHRLTELQDMEQAMLAGSNDEPDALPEELQEAAQEAVVQLLQQHYEKWLDEPVPMLDGATPRAAADVAALRPRVAELIEGLESLYEQALDDGSGAFDPTWMWEELRLEDLARGRSRKQGVPRLPHEVMAELAPELADAAADLGDRIRRSSRNDLSRVIDAGEIKGDLGFHRVVREAVADAKEDGSSGLVAAAEGAVQAAWIGILGQFELHLRKVFWVEEGLAWMLGATSLDVTAEALRPPFTSFALVFTDRYSLGLSERLLAESPSARLRARILSVLTVYVTATVVDDERTEMRIALAADASDGGFPELVVRDVVLRKGAGIADILRTVSPGDEGAELPTIVASPPLRGLLGLVFNAMLYATSADVKAVPGDPRGAAAPAPRRRRNGEVPPNDGVFRLPGKIDILSLRQLKRVRRGSSDVQAIRRCMVRGHWRRAGQSWKDENPRWIKPYWRGPSAAAIVEREYRLK